MNSEENHGFTSFDFITMIVSFSVIAIVTAPIIRKNIQADQSVDQARMETSQIGISVGNPKNISILTGDFKNRLPNDRSVASVPAGDGSSRIDLESLKSHLKKGEWEGTTERLDPWGRAYHFSFLRNSKGVATHVAVWSEGPNQNNETVVQGDQAKLDHPENFQFKGDDLGSVIPLR
jgi:hypothetical protein